MSTEFLMATAVAQGTPAGLGTVLFLAALTAIGMLAGVGAMRRFETWAIRHTAELVAFAAGLLVSGALLHLLGRAVQLIGTDAGLGWAFVSFLVFYLLEAHFVPHVHARGDAPIEDSSHAHPHPHQHAHHVGPLVVLGLGLHSIIDGVSVGAGLSAGAVIGSVTAMLVVVHKLPVGIAAMSALYLSGVPGGRATLVSTGLAAVTPLAVIISYFAFRSVSDQLLGVLLALAGGSFLYVGAADLLPEGQATGRPANTLMFIAGAIIMGAIKVVAH